MVRRRSDGKSRGERPVPVTAGDPPRLSDPAGRATVAPIDVLMKDRQVRRVPTHDVRMLASRSISGGLLALVIGGVAALALLGLTVALLPRTSQPPPADRAVVAPEVRGAPSARDVSGIDLPPTGHDPESPGDPSAPDGTVRSGPDGLVPRDR